MNTEIQSTLFQEDFLANLSPLPGNNEARKMTATSGLKCYELLERLNRKSLLAKTLLESLTWHSTRCFLTWRVKATKQRRLLFQLVPSTPLTDEIEYGLLPTPNTGGMDGGSNSGFIITNSEVGQGSFEIRPRALVLKCKNGLISTDDRFRRVHLGAQLKEGQIQWSEQTKQKNFELVISQTKDAIKTFLSKDYLGTMLVRIADAAGVKLNNPVDTVQHVCRELMVTEERRRDILGHFLEGGDFSAAGVFHALTRGAQDWNADDRFELEAKAYDIIPRIGLFDRPFSKN